MDHGSDIKLTSLNNIYILKTPASTPTESMYLEHGILRIGTIVKARRINFPHYLLRRNETEMMYQIFSVQWNQLTKNDWAYFVKQDLIDFRIEPDLLNLKNKSEWSLYSQDSTLSPNKFFGEDSPICTRARGVNVRAHVSSRLRAYTPRARVQIGESSPKLLSFEHKDPSFR